MADVAHAILSLVAQVTAYGLMAFLLLLILGMLYFYRDDARIFVLSLAHRLGMIDADRVPAALEPRSRFYGVRSSPLVKRRQLPPALPFDKFKLATVFDALRESEQLELKALYSAAESGSLDAQSAIVERLAGSGHEADALFLASAAMHRYFDAYVWSQIPSSADEVRVEFGFLRHAWPDVVIGPFLDRLASAVTKAADAPRWRDDARGLIDNVYSDMVRAYANKVTYDINHNHKGDKTRYWELEVEEIEGGDLIAVWQDWGNPYGK